MNSSWYVMQVASNKEDVAQRSLVLNIKNKMLSNPSLISNIFGVDSDVEIDEILANIILVPKEKIEDIRNGKKRENMRKMFPGYVFIKMIYSNDAALFIKEALGISSTKAFIGATKASKPIPISEAEVTNILNQINQSKDKAKHKIEFEAGERVRIIDGPFLDFNAIIEEVLYEKLRLKVNVQIFGRETGVELEIKQVEKI